MKKRRHCQNRAKKKGVFLKIGTSMGDVVCYSNGYNTYFGRTDFLIAARIPEDQADSAKVSGGEIMVTGVPVTVNRDGTTFERHVRRRMINLKRAKQLAYATGSTEGAVLCDELRLAANKARTMGLLPQWIGSHTKEQPKQSAGFMRRLLGALNPFSIFARA